ncbi:hypothetical protein SRABI128_05502 [Microbacterium sp. Bi128]|nr:hypothetical protein SRABI128_05502 [Microbacterium sp. Bi128]
MRADLRARVDGAAVKPDACAAGRAVAGDLADVGPEAVGRVLRGDAALQGGTLELDALLGQAQVREALTGGDAQLRLDEIDVGDFLGHRVLDLDPGVHFDEYVLAGPLTHRVDKEFDGTGVDVVQRFRELHGVAVQRLPDAFVQVRRRGDLDDLLVAALDGTVTLEEVHHVALRVGQDLDLDVARAQDGLLQEHGGVAERGVGFAHGGLQGLRERLAGVHAAHAAPAAAGDGLGKNGEADFIRGGDQFVQVLRRLAGLEDRDAGLARGLEGGNLITGEFQNLGRRADEGDAGLLRGPRQARVLGEETVTGVNGVRPGLLGDAHHLINVQVGPDRMSLLADQIRLIGLLAVNGVAVLMGKHSDSLGTQLVARAEGANRDFAAVGHQNLRKHTSPASSRAYR